MSGHLGDDTAVELALGLTAGPERAEALTHLSGCVECRAAVDELARAVDALLAVTPLAEPSAGFEGRVLDALPESSAPRAAGRKATRRRVVALAFGAALVVSGGVVGVATLAFGGGSPVAHAEMTTTDGVPVGTVFVHDGEPAWVLLSLPGWEGWDVTGYRVSLEYEDGEVSYLQPLGGGNGGTWAVTTSLDLAGIARIAVLNDEGREFCGATF